MNCPSCGAELKPGNQFCEACGKQISYDMKREQEQMNKQGCPICHSSNVTFNREKQSEIKGKNGTQIIRHTVGVCKDCGHTWFIDDNSSEGKPKLWLWILGWICIFPVPLTILMLRKKDLSNSVKYGVIAASWIVYLLIGLFGSPNDTKSTTTADTSQIATQATSEATTGAPSDSNVMDVTLQVEPNVNDEDGTVLFGVTTNLPEDTELLVTVTNDKGYKAQDKTVVTGIGVGYTAEFSNKGKGLKGKFNVCISMGLPKLQKKSVRKVIGENGEKIGGQYVVKSESDDANYVSGDFEFEF